MEALSNGGEMPSGWTEADGSYRPNTRHVHWDVSGSCQSPVRLTLSSKESVLWKRVLPRMTDTLEVPCRKCEACLRKRAALWRFRAIREISEAERTWFATLTFKPEEHYRLEIMCGAPKGMGGLGANLAGLSDDAKFPYLARMAGKELTRFLKRVRKNSGRPLRYLSVVEKHDSAATSNEMRGRPHLHLLIHEQAGAPIAWKCLDAAWTVGHSKFKLVADIKGAMYLTKYISKEAGARIRASVNYGERSSPDDAL